VVPLMCQNYAQSDPVTPMERQETPVRLRLAPTRPRSTDWFYQTAGTRSRFPTAIPDHLLLCMFEHRESIDFAAWYQGHITMETKTHENLQGMKLRKVYLF